ncbi:ABC transporter permease [Herbiconiux sp. KACC 21604]|uniref:ABC transporter permease n=1 Tax=unclassified Herbiconiux TaxID=2618217 RepID=UPI001492F514|nr:ABC transporter permease [Herbiconiux sp. SALV-R1]QJU55680.1 ABC transporter permease [Herbiconiux sp. SALV-R1]WPO86883.1 ABC transporter permease [Herbiconiux sp. KACC 21604]
MRRPTVRHVLLGVFVAVVSLFLVLPTLIIIPMSFNSSSTLGVFNAGWTTEWYENLVTDPSWGRAALTSLQVAIGTTLLSTALGTAAAMGIQRLPERARLLLLGVLLSPLIIPPVIIGIGLYVLYLRWYLDGTIPGLIAAHTILSVPFVVVTVSASLSQVDPVYERAAASLGAPPWVRFRRVLLPMIAPGVFGGALFAFVSSWDEVVISIFVTDATTRTLPVLMWSQMRTQVTPTLAAIGVLLTILSLIALVATRRLTKGQTS